MFSFKMAILKRNEDKMKCDGQKCSMESVEENSSIGERYLKGYILETLNFNPLSRGTPIKTKTKTKKDGKKAKKDETKKAKSRACTLL